MGKLFNLRQRKPPRKWEVYEQILRIPYYVVFSRCSIDYEFLNWWGALPRAIAGGASVDF